MYCYTGLCRLDDLLGGSDTVDILAGPCISGSWEFTRR